MKQYCMLMHQQLQRQLVFCRKKRLFFEKEIETCFQLANICWNNVKEKLNTYQFKDDVEEIEFFKRLKPKFTAHIEYYGLLYHSIVFEPIHFDSTVRFWGIEHRRLKKFEEANKSFLSCYKNQGHVMTPYYFLRRYCACENNAGVKMYDAGSRTCTNGDHLAATFLALKRYMPFVEKKMATL
jgi:hypothetical protein